MMKTITLPPELLDHTLQYLDAIDRSDPQWKGQSLAPFETAWHNAKQEFCRLRLVNHAFHDSATPCLFRYIDGVMRAPSHKKSSHIWAARLSNLGSSRIAYHIRKLDIGFDEASWTPDALSDFVRASARVIPGLINTCHRLQVLRISGAPQSVFGHDLYRKEPPPYLLEMFTRIIMDVFTRLSLRGADSKLRTLHLSLPLTYYFSEIHRTATEKSGNGNEASALAFMTHLHSLSLSISFASYVNFAEAHQKYPNWVFMEGFWSFVQCARNIHTLQVRSTVMGEAGAADLDVDLLPTLHLPVLTKLSLFCTKISEDEFIAFTTKHASTLTSLQLERITLKAGTWESLLSRLRGLPHLRSFEFGAGSYDKYGASAHLHLANGGLFGELVDIHGLNAGDMPALERLQRYLGNLRMVRGQGNH